MTARQTRIMGILNVTPDSFYDGGKYFSPEDAFLHAVQLVEDGADIIDVGGESTRPGAKPVSLQEEIDRVVPVVERIAQNIDVKISVDTTKSEVAEQCLRHGAHIVNDISSFTFDKKMPDIVLRYGCEIILMHIRGIPENMQDNIHYDNLLSEIKGFLSDSAEMALKSGIAPEKIIIDPGIGFGKELEHNYQIINMLPELKTLGFRLLLGLSRKSLIWKLYDDKSIDRLPATIALNMIGVYNGADIIRVHDVKQHRLALDAVQYLMENYVK